MIPVHPIAPKKHWRGERRPAPANGPPRSVAGRLPDDVVDVSAGLEARLAGARFAAAFFAGAFFGSAAAFLAAPFFVAAFLAVFFAATFASPSSPPLPPPSSARLLRRRLLRWFLGRRFRHDDQVLSNVLRSPRSPSATIRRQLKYACFFLQQARAMSRAMRQRLRHRIILRARTRGSCAHCASAGRALSRLACAGRGARRAAKLRGHESARSRGCLFDRRGARASRLERASTPARARRSARAARGNRIFLRRRWKNSTSRALAARAIAQSPESPPLARLRAGRACASARR